MRPVVTSAVARRTKALNSILNEECEDVRCKEEQEADHKK